jgi:hypothetical protein
MPRFVIVSLVVTSFLLLGHVAASPSDVLADITVIGDDDRDAFVGNGSLLLPPQIATSNRRVAADCPGCRWRSVIQCEMTTAGSCRGPARLCGPDGYWLRVFLIRADGVEINLGAACFGSGGPVSRAVAEAVIRDQVEVLVPPLRMWRQPNGRVLPHLPVVFGVGQEETPLTRSVQLLGLPVDITARPSWVWDFGGEVLRTLSAGRRWPDPTVTHTYRRSGDPDVRVTAVWVATYEVAGVGPLEVPERVTQVDDASVPVGQGRALLVR